MERCIERLHEVAEAGVRQIIVAQFVPDPMDFMQTFAARVLPEFN
jgi:predicted metal-dependent TIM-barrel fold hydrolase